MKYIFSNPSDVFGAKFIFIYTGDNLRITRKQITIDGNDEFSMNFSSISKAFMDENKQIEILATFLVEHNTKSSDFTDTSLTKDERINTVIKGFNQIITR